MPEIPEISTTAPAAASPEAGAAVSTYDAVPYSVGAFPQTHPDRLATIATLFGMRPAPPHRCRVLELGCASGGNLIPMAWAMPESTFVGVDLSARQIDDGRAVVAELGLPNCDLRAMSITEIGPDAGQFDYVLAHGVYSWVPPHVQEAILDVCRDHLSPHGVAYVSYNTYPGWHARAAIREMLWYHAGRFADPADRIREARGLLAFLADAVPADDAGFGSLVRRELALLRMTPDTYLLHEHLEEFNEPLYFHQFAGRAAAKRLQYLGEAQVTSMMPGRFGAETERTLRAISPDLLHMEQYMDFLRNRMFRQTLLCRADVPLDRALRPEAVFGFRIASPASAADAAPGAAPEPEGTRHFRAPAGATLTTRDPLMVAAMTHLGAQWPRPVAFDELLDAAKVEPPTDGERRQLATRLLHCYASGLTEFSLAPPRMVADVSDRPIASPYARARAKDGLKVTNLRLESVALTAPSQLVLRQLDGRHDRPALVALVADWIDRNASPGRSAGAANQPSASASAEHSPGERAAAYVDAVLKAFARTALLVG
jgi:methyltransferase-like protein